MKDAGFYVPADKRARFAAGYHETKANSSPSPPPTAFPPTTIFSQPRPRVGGGLVSPRRLLPLCANAPQSRPIGWNPFLAPATVKLMTSNHLSESCSRQIRHCQHIMVPGFGYGYDCAVVFTHRRQPADGKGTFFWSGAAVTGLGSIPQTTLVFVA